MVVKGSPLTVAGAAAASERAAQCVPFRSPRGTVTGLAIRAGKLVEVLPGCGGKEDDGVYAILPPGRLVPTKTRVFVEEVTQSIKAGWSQ